MHHAYFFRTTLLLSNALLLCACSLALAPQKATIESVLLDESVRSGDIVCEVEGVYPHITGLHSVQVEANINSYFDEYVYGIKEDVRLCPEYYRELAMEGAELLDTTYIDYAIARSDDDYLSVTLLRSQYVKDAAHPNNWIDTLTFDMETGQPIALEDLFVTDSNYEEELLDYVTAAVAENDLGQYPSQSSNPIEKFYLTDSSLVLVDLFSTYAAQAFEVRIPLRELKGKLRVMQHLPST